jgi:hypothetical protein
VFPGIFAPEFIGALKKRVNDKGFSLHNEISLPKIVTFLGNFLLLSAHSPSIRSAKGYIRFHVEARAAKRRLPREPTNTPPTGVGSGIFDSPGQRRSWQAVRAADRRA